MQGLLRELALFDLGINSKLRVLQQKTRHPVQFEVTPPTRDALKAWDKSAGPKADSFLFPGRVLRSPNLGTRPWERRTTRGWLGGSS